MTLLSASPGSGRERLYTIHKIHKSRGCRGRSPVGLAQDPSPTPRNGTRKRRKGTRHPSQQETKRTSTSGTRIVTLQNTIYEREVSVTARARVAWHGHRTAGRAQHPRGRAGHSLDTAQIDRSGS